MKNLRIILFVSILVCIIGILFFWILNYAITIPDDKRITFEEAAKKAEEYVNNPKCIATEGCYLTGNTIDRNAAFPVYATRDDIPDYYYFPIKFKGEKDWPDTVGVYLFLGESYATGNYWKILDELKGAEKTNKLYNLGDRWYGVPENISSETVVETYGHDFSKPNGPQRGSMSFFEFTNLLHEYRNARENSKSHPLYRMKILKQSIGEIWLINENNFTP